MLKNAMFSLTLAMLVGASGCRTVGNMALFVFDAFLSQDDDDDRRRQHEAINATVGGSNASEQSQYLGSEAHRQVR